MRPSAPKRAPWVLEHRIPGAEPVLDIHVRVALHGDGDDARANALAALKQAVADLDRDDWARALMSGGVQLKREPVQGPFHTPTAKRPPRPKAARPAVELAAGEKKTCDQILEALLLLGIHGRAVPVGDLHKKGGIPQARLYDALRHGTDTWRFLEGFVSEMRCRGKRLLDLNPDGRRLASQIRAR